MSHVLIADDDPHIRQVIGIALEDAGMTVTEVENGKRAVTEAQRLSPDLVVLDVGMPEMDGFEACKAIRKRSDVPLLFLTARDEEINRVVGFELGADDYVVKPFSPRELVLRVRAILGRTREKIAEQPIVSHGDLTMDAERHLCQFAGETVELTGTEFGLLRALCEAPERVLSREQLIRAAYGANMHLSDRTVDSHIRNIRGKAAKAGYDDVIATVHGVGLKLGSCQR
ncbi:MAG: response regulator transcription factor [Pseudomonadota bacterium]